MRHISFVCVCRKGENFNTSLDVCRSMSVGPDSGGEGVAGGGGFHVNPYHQAWAAQAEQGPGLSLVEEAGVAHIVMGGNNVVDMFDFQINQKQFPAGFFKKDPKTGIQRRFTCLVCNVSLFDENLVRTHCFSQVRGFIVYLC